MQDGTVCLSRDSNSLNAHTKLRNYPTIHYGGEFKKHLFCIWWLRILRSHEDILIFDNSVNSCFQHAKIILELMNAFSFILQG